MPKKKASPGFIADSSPDLDTEEKNAELGAALQQAPWRQRKIATIKRNEPDKGWDVTYT